MKKAKNRPASPWLLGGTFPPERPVIDICRHEAGHMVVARVLGFDTGKFTFSVAEAGAEINPAPDLKDIPSVLHYIERRIPVLYAGAMAEALKSNKIDNDLVLEILRDDRGKNDFAKVRELLQIYSALTRGEKSMDDVHQANNDKLWNRGGELVEKYATQIVALSKEWRAKIGGSLNMEISNEETLQVATFADIKVGEGIDVNDSPATE